MVQTEPCVPEAVKRPAAVMLPHEAFHVTDALAVNCWVCPWPVAADEGVITMGEDMFAVVEVT